MILQTLINYLQDAGFLDWRSIIDLIGAAISGTDCTASEGSTCPGSAFNYITAAFATQGYWAQADILDYFNETAMGHLAALVYVLAAIGGLFGMAFGAPPKMWIWFLFGPGIFYWLTVTSSEDTSVDGVRVMMGAPTGLFYNEGVAAIGQKRVWELSRVGLQSMGIFQRYGCDFDELTGAPTGCSGGERSKGSGAVQPAYLFVIFDKYLSYLLEFLVDWTGVYSTVDTGDGSTPSLSPDHLMSNLKWRVVEDITSAKLSSADIRDMFVTFLTSECGSGFSSSINTANYVAASSSAGSTLPYNIFYGGGPDGDFAALMQAFNGQSIPVPRSLNRLLNSGAASPISFINSVPGLDKKISATIPKSTIDCNTLLQTIIYGFRWESGQAYYQMLTDTPPGMDPKKFIANLVLGWPIKEDLATGLGLGSLIGYDGDSFSMELMPSEDLEQFFINLIMVHMVKNEFTIAPQPKTGVNSGAQDAVAFSETYLRTVGQKTKFSELYNWALMTPHLQGVLLYLLAMAYPFVCLFMIIPGWHKLIVTWMTFWIWAKMWDLGFAIVTVLERSVWAIIGNNKDISYLFSMVNEMKSWGKVSVSCIGAGRSPLDTGFCTMDTPIPSVTLPGITDITPEAVLINAYHLLDRAMTVGLSIDLDLSNSYYVYIMAALYFAVPAVTGQLVLGAKASAASIAQNAFGGMAGDAGKAAGSGFSGNLSKQTEANASTAKQNFQAKAMRSGAASTQVSNALNWGNRAMAGDLSATTWTAASRGNSRLARINALQMEEINNGMQTGQALIGADMALRTSEKLLGVGGRELMDAVKSAPTPSGSAPLPTGVPTGSGMPTGARTPTGAGSPTGGPILDKAQSLYNSMLQGYKALADAQSAVGGYQLKKANTAFQAATEARQEQFDLRAGRDSTLSKGLSDGARVQEAMAEQLSQEATWEGMRDYANQTSGTLAAMGVSSAISPGAKPAIMKGMAGTGMLGQGNQKAALYTSDGTYSKAVNRSYDWLESKYGEGQLSKAFKQYSVDEAYKMGADVFRESTTNPGLTQTIQQRADAVTRILNAGGGDFGYHDQIVNGNVQSGGLGSAGFDAQTRTNQFGGKDSAFTSGTTRIPDSAPIQSIADGHKAEVTPAPPPKPAVDTADPGRMTPTSPFSLK